MLSLLQLKASQTECEYGGVLYLSKDIFICTYYGENRWIGKPKHNDVVLYTLSIPNPALLLLCSYGTCMRFQHLYNPTPLQSNTSTIQHLYNPTPLQSNTSTIQHLYNPTPLLSNILCNPISSIIQYSL